MTNLKETKRALAGIFTDLGNYDGSLWIEKQIEAYAPFQNGTANSENFFFNTAAIFTPEKNRPRRKPDFVSSDRNGKVSSEYWFTAEGVVRGSAHWGCDVASCDWTISGQRIKTEGVNNTSKLYGFAEWTSFTHKTNELTTPDGETVYTNFENTTGRREYEVNGKKYMSLKSSNEIMEVA